MAGSLYAGSAQAFEFGAIQLRSSLNQPLDATIRLSSVTESDRAGLRVSIASSDMFKRFGIQRSADVDAIRLKVQPGGGPGQVIVHASTDAPISDPIVDFLLQADTGSGSALHEYTVLLNPAPMQGTASSDAVSGNAGTYSRAPDNANDRAAAAEPSSNAASDYASGAASSGYTPRSSHSRTGGHYGPVSDGQTLYAIAAEVRGPGMSVEQMEVALYRANPAAFGTGMNNLLRGATLTVPAATVVNRISDAEARAAMQATYRHAPDQPDRKVSDSSSPAVASGELPPGAIQTSAIHVSADGQFGQLTMPDEATWKRMAGPSVARPIAAPDATAGMALSDTMAAPAVGGSSAANATNAAAGPANAAMTAAPAATAPGVQLGSAVSAPMPVVSSVGAPLPGTQSNVASNVMNVASAPSPNSMTATSSGNVDARASANVLSAAPGIGAGPTTAATTEPATTVPATTVAGSASGGVLPVAGSPAVAEGGDVSQAGAGSLFSPRNVLLFIFVVILGGLAAWWRRRQYRELPPLDESAAADHSPPAGTASVANTAGTLGAADLAGQPGPVAAPAAGRDSILGEVDALMQQGAYSRARERLEAGLAVAPHDAELQDKLLELDYLAGDAARFSLDFTRFEADINASGRRKASIAAKGRVLLNHDPRFAADVPAAAVSTAPIRESASSRPVAPVQPSVAGEDATPAVAQPGASSPADTDIAAGQTHPSVDSNRSSTGVGAADSVDSSGLQLEDSADELSGYEWEPETLPAESERQHDRSDAEGLSFDLDTGELDAGDGNLSPRPIARDEPAADDQAPPMLDIGDFDLDSDTAAPEKTLDGDSAEIRLDLARMYIEMEDTDMARGLLEEVQSGGTEAQQETARSLLNQISA